MKSPRRCVAAPERERRRGEGEGEGEREGEGRREPVAAPGRAAAGTLACMLALAQSDEAGACLAVLLPLSLPCEAELAAAVLPVCVQYG